MQKISYKIITGILIYFSICLPAAASSPQAKQIADVQLKRFGDKYAAKIDEESGIIYISALDEAHLTQTMLILKVFNEALQKNLFKTPRNAGWYITVILPAADDYRKLAPAENVAGFYDPANRTLTSIDYGRVLLHEFTHALHHRDMAAASQIHPIWLCEGMASLFENGSIGPDGIQPSVDLRILSLQRAIKQKQTLPLEGLVGFNHSEFVAQSELAYAQSRYLMMYLQNNKLLEKYYIAYKTAYAADETGTKTLEKILGQRLSEFQAQWEKWATGLELPRGILNSEQGRLGVEMKNDKSGVKVVSLLPGGAAEKAGRLRIGDVIQKFNGRQINNIAELSAAIRAAGANQTVEIQLTRAGREMTILHPLGQPVK